MKKLIGLFALILSFFAFSATSHAATCRVAQLSATPADTMPPAQTLTTGTNNVLVAAYDVTATCDLTVGTVYIQTDPTTGTASMGNVRVYAGLTELTRTTSTAGPSVNDGAYVFGPMTLAANTPQKLTVYADIPTNAPEGAFKTYISGFGTVPGTTAGNGAGKMFSTPGYPFAKGNTITVVAPQAAPTLVVLSPNGGEQFSLNNSLPYSYKLTYRPYGTTTISLVQFPSLTNPGIVHSFGGGWGENNEPDYIKYGNIGTIGNYSNITPGTYYWKVEYRSDDGTQNLVDFSDAPFSIITGISPTAPVLQVVSPNGGETYTEGQQITVKWNTQNIPASATLTLNLLSHTNPTAMHPLRNDAGNVTFSNDGEETVLLPPPAFGWHNGLNYKVRILVTGTPSMVDDSDNYFSITTANSNPVLPAGCTSTVGFSPVTGMPCSGTGGRPTIAPAPVAPATPGIVKAAFTRELKLGMSGADVTALQNRLMAEGVYTSKISGYFGTMTQAAVKRYQNKYGIPAVGAIGPRTLQVLNK